MDFELSTLLPVLGPTGILVIFVIYWIISKQRSPDTSILTSVLKRLDKLEKENDEFREKNMELEVQIQKLRYDLALMESAHQDLPLPQWLKDKDGVILAINRAYEQMFLIPLGKTRADYVGHTDVNVWGEEVGKQFSMNDFEVARTGRVLNTTETFPVNGVMTEYRIIKYPRYAGGVVIGIAGIAIPPLGELIGN